MDRGCNMHVHTDNPIPAIVGVALFVAWYVNVDGHLLAILRRRRSYARWTNAWRERIATMPDRPFHYRLLTESEQTRLINSDGQTSEQWMRDCAADFIAGRRSSMPTCGDYLAEFGRRTKVRPAEPRTLAGNRLAGISGQRK